MSNLGTGMSNIHYANNPAEVQQNSQKYRNATKTGENSHSRQQQLKLPERA